LLERLGFTCVRSKGSHFAYRHSDGRATTLPYHGPALLSVKFIKRLLGQIGVSDEDYVRLVSKL
jgi:predicted RNA binding protein YcfA (HicA-like mRNA interferase family)